ncbi:MAG: hypothetical protein DRP62_08870 [Planctomycetota bacterium]|nr:MAG: hypothetical protein DRP62_08870 [Planctomycetota bacterium]
MLGSGKFLNKKIVFILVVVLILIIGGIFLWINKPKEIKGSPDDYVIKETQEGIVVENSRAGLRFKVPDGWKARKVEVEEGSVVLYSPDAESVYQGKIRPPLKKGCMIEIAVGYRKKTFEEIEKDIREELKLLGVVKSEKFERIEIKNSPALKITFNCSDLGSNIDVYIPRDRMFYGIGMSVGPQELERCNQELDRFLETISFR